MLVIITILENKNIVEKVRNQFLLPAIQAEEALAQEKETMPWSVIAWHFQPVLRTMLAVIGEAIDFVEIHCCIISEELK